MNEGKKFEEQFKKSLIKDGLYVLRLPDPPQSFSQNDTFLRFSNKNPYDFQVYKHPFLYCLELKSTSSSSISIQFDKKEKGKNIKLHQVYGLSEADNHVGTVCGFIFNFRKTNNTYFLEIDYFNKFLMESSKKSINEEDVIQNGGLIIPQYLKRTSYHYDFLKIINQEEYKDGF